MSENKWRVYISDVSPSGGESTGAYQIITQEAEPTLSIAGNEIDSGKTTLIKKRFDVGTIRTNTIVESTASAGITINPTAAGPSMFFTNPYMAKLERSSSQTIASTTFTKVDFRSASGATAVYDTSNQMADLTNGRINIKRNGIYVIHTYVRWNGLSASPTSLSIYIYKNNILEHRNIRPTTLVSNSTLEHTYYTTLSASDYIDSRVYHFTGSNETIISGELAVTYMGDS